MTIYAIGDIHGQRALLEQALDRIEADGGAGAEVVFLGDYTDRGPDSRGVIDLLVAGLAEGRRWTCLLGNHDRMFHRFATSGVVTDDNIKSGAPWTHERLGGLATLASYGIRRADTCSTAELWQAAQAAVPAAHVAFLGSRPLLAERDGLLFVHAGIRPGVALSDQVEDDLIWIRSPFLEHPAPHPWLVVHGHTAGDGIEHAGNRVNLDGGAGYGRALRVGCFEGDAVFELTSSGRVPLTADA